MNISDEMVEAFIDATRFEGWRKSEDAEYHRTQARSGLEAALTAAPASAAAQDMLAALKRLTDYSRTPTQADWQAADEAVAKAEGLAALAAPASAAEPVDDFGAHILETLGFIGGREIGKGHVVLSEERYQWLRTKAGITIDT